MNFWNKIILFLLMLSSFSNVIAHVENNYHFTSPVQAELFTKLLSELRCLVCQNQSLAESNAPLARDLKQEVYEQVRRGFPEMQIKHYLVQRYGEYILFKPSVNNITFVLWLGPFVFLIGAFGILFLSMRQQKIKSDDIEQEVILTQSK